MFKSKLAFILSAFVATVFLVVSCSKDVKSSPKFIHKKAPNDSIAFKMGDIEVSHEELNNGIENEVYEAEMKLYELKMNKVRSILLEKLMNTDPKKKGLSNDQYLDKYIANDIKVSQKDIDAFIKERGIPKTSVNETMKQRIEKFLSMDKKKQAVENWLASKTSKTPVEIYFQKPSRPVFEVAEGDSPFMGGADAKVTIIEFSDFQCPYCSKAANTMTEIKKKYGNKVKVVFKNFPLPFHKDAKLAAEAGLCAQEIGGNKAFWKVHDKFFADQTKLKRDDLVATAKSAGLDMSKFEKCLDSHKFRAKVDADMELGKSVGVKSTPTFFVNGKLVPGAYPLETFVELIEESM